MTTNRRAACAVAALAFAVLSTAQAGHKPAQPPAPPASAAVPAPEAQHDEGSFCFYTGRPSSGPGFTTLRKLELKKGSYGGVAQMLPRLAEDARQAGGDAIVDYDGAQRFGLFPWRMVRPVVHGVPIKWNGPAPDCAASGGTTLATIVDTRQAPSRAK